MLHHRTRDSLARSPLSRSPLLHHLNADTSWLLQLPRPGTATEHTGRQWFNILIDPWLHGSQSDVAGWFSRQWHADDPCISSIAKVEELAREIEIISSELWLGKGSQPNSFENVTDLETFIDAVAISHEFTDHCHKETLLEVHPEVPVFATQKAAKLVKSWKHFRHVLETPIFSHNIKGYSITSLPLLPEWLTISRLVTENDALHFHSALLIVFDVTSAVDQSTQTEAVIYSPHGIEPSSLTCVANATPPIHTLAIMHGLHDVSIGSQRQLNLGAHNGLAVQRLLRAQYWIGTHDEVKEASGLISWFLGRKTLSVQDALEEEDQKAPSFSDSSVGQCKTDTEKWKNPRFINIGNGESAVLT